MARSENVGGSRRDNNAAAWLLLPVICCAGLALVLLAGGTGLAGAGIVRESAWPLIAGVVVITIALVWWRMRITRGPRDHS
jgi:hypothetical protein